MNILLPLSSNSVEYIDVLVRSWSRVTVAFYSNSHKSKSAADGYGSGFIVYYKKRHYLVTAKHVVEQAQENDINVINVNGQSFILHKIYFVTDDSNDIAVSVIDDFLMENELRKTPAINLDAEEKGVSIGDYLLLGYPGTKSR